MKNFLKNVSAYCGELPAAKEFERLIADHEFTEGAKSSPLQKGFYPNEHTGKLVMPLADDGYIFRFKIQERKVPSSVLKEELKKSIASVEQNLGYKPGRKQKKELKEALLFELTSHAFPVGRVIECVYRPKTRQLLISTGSKRDADMITSAIIRAMKAAKFTTIYVDNLTNGITTRLRAWLEDDELAFEGFDVGGFCELNNGTHTVKFILTDLRDESEKIIELLDAGYVCKIIELVNRSGNQGFSLNTGLQVRKIQHGDTERAEEHDDAQHFVAEASARALITEAIMTALCGMFGFKEPETKETE